MNACYALLKDAIDALDLETAQETLIRAHLNALRNALRNVMAATRNPPPPPIPPFL